MSKKAVWYQSYIDRINEKLKEYDSSTFEYQEFTKHKYFACYQVFIKGKGTFRLIFVATKFQKSIDILTKNLNYGKNDKGGQAEEDSSHTH